MTDKMKDSADHKAPGSNGRVDRASKDSFPASDPPAYTGWTVGAPGPRKSEKAKKKGRA